MREVENRVILMESRACGGVIGEYMRERTRSSFAIHVVGRRYECLCMYPGR